MSCGTGRGGADPKNRIAKGGNETIHTRVEEVDKDLYCFWKIKGIPNIRHIKSQSYIP